MSVPADQIRNHISEIRAASREILDAFDRYRAARKEWDNKDLFNVLTDEDFTGTEHEGITKAQFAAAVSSLEAIEGFATANQHDDALYSVR